MPKNKGRNAFYFFMCEWKRRAERQGAVFPQGLKDVQLDPDCNAEWKNLSKQQRGEYEAMAKQDKITSQVSNVKRTSYGESIEHIKARERQQEQFKKHMNNDIKSMISKALSEKNLPLKIFVLIHTNYFFKKIVNYDKIVYFPAEYAVSIFSLEHGILETQNLIVSAPIPLGYKREALERYKEFHGIPIEYEGGYKNFADMYAKLVDFLSPYKNEHNKYPPLYTTNENLLQVRSLLEQLCQDANQDIEQFVVYELETLYTYMGLELFKKNDNRDPKYIPVYSNFIFTRYMYGSDKGSECSFHKYSSHIDACSSFVLQRWAWILCGEFCELLGIDMRLGVHCPLKEKSDNFASMIKTLGDLNINSKSESPDPEDAILSMTNVSEKHRMKVSSRTYEDERRRREQSAPIQIIRCNASDEETDEAACAEFDSVNPDKSVENPVERPIRDKWVPTYFNEKPMKPPNIDSCTSITVNNDAAINSSNFPSIGKSTRQGQVALMQIYYGRNKKTVRQRTRKYELELLGKKYDYLNVVVLSFCASFK